MTVALALPNVWLDDDTVALVTALESQLTGYQPQNQVKENYYELKQHLKDLGIAIPPQLRGMSCCIGWPATTVDCLEERLDFRGWLAPAGDDFGLGDVYEENHLEVEASWCHLDTLLYGTAFAAVSTGFDDEPDPLVTIESPTSMTAFTDIRTRRVEAALSLETDDAGAVQFAVLYLPEATLWLSAGAGRWRIEERDDHGLGRVPIAQFINRPRAGDMNGRSEITPAIMYYTDAAMRTLAASEVAREFHASPQRWVMGAPESFFLDDDGNPRDAWQSYLGRILAIERDASDQVPTVGQFTGSSMGPYFDQIRALSQLVAAEAAIPIHYLGFVSDNPTSADAIRQGEARLVKRVERRQKQFGREWTEVGRLALLVRDGTVPDEYADTAPLWAGAATPTKAADADRIAKLIDAGVLQPDSAVTWNQLGFTPEEQQQLEIEARRQSVAELVTSIAAAAEATRAAQAAAAAGPPAPAEIAPPAEEAAP